jgi:hypothetical protein
VEHLAAVAEMPRGSSRRAKNTWFGTCKKLLKEGKVAEIIRTIKGMAKGRNAHEYLKAAAYFEQHKDRMQYHKIKRKHLPIGSGIVESAIRQVINLRLKGAGIFWIKKNAENYVHLRSYLMAKRWDVLENAVISRPSWGCT